MKHSVAIAIVLGILFFVLLCLPGTAEAVIIRVTYVNAPSAAAQDRWNEVISETQLAYPGSIPFDVIVEWQSLGFAKPVIRQGYYDVVYEIDQVTGSILAYTCCTLDSSGCPKRAKIVINTSQPISWDSLAPTNNRYDGLTIARHELCHALGMYYGAYQKFTERIASGPRFVGCGLDIELYANDPNHMADHNDLMYPFLAWNVRKPRSATVDSMLRDCAFAQFYRRDTVGSIAGVAWNDLDSNGIKNPGEPVLAGWRVSNGADTVLTDAQGRYAFSNLPPNTYTIAIIPESGWTLTAPPTGFYTVNVDTGSVIDTLNFGNAPPACCPKGDMNGDWQMTPSDVVGMLNCVFMENGCAPCKDDLNGDGNNTPSDVVMLLNCVFMEQCGNCP